ncbi:hypothetical protein BTW14_gp201 [BeAn 58058 virus]|nr:hypothetical protein BTW14_gp201 [BeAn 58058 virus]APG58392.1 hypothetical protein BAV00220 [BeAn 58058 virus]
MTCVKDEPTLPEDSSEEHDYVDEDDIINETAMPISVDNEILAAFNRNKAPVIVNDMLTVNIDKSCVKEVAVRLHVKDFCETVKRFPETSYIQEYTYPKGSSFEDFEENTPGYPTLC